MGLGSWEVRCRDIRLVAAQAASELRGEPAATERQHAGVHGGAAVEAHRLRHRGLEQLLPARPSGLHQLDSLVSQLVLLEHTPPHAAAAPPHGFAAALGASNGLGVGQKAVRQRHWTATGFGKCHRRCVTRWPRVFLRATAQLVENGNEQVFGQEQQEALASRGMGLSRGSLLALAAGGSSLLAAAGHILRRCRGCASSWRTAEGMLKRPRFR